MSFNRKENFSFFGKGFFQKKGKKPLSLFWPFRIPALLFILLIKIYRLTLSRILPTSCRFYPSCSQYALEAFSHYGFFRAFWMSVKRILKCHPFHPGGYDPVIHQNQSD